MKTLYDVQEWLKKYGFVNLFPNRYDAILFMQQELKRMVDQGIIEKTDHDYMTVLLILRQEERIEIEKESQ